MAKPYTDELVYTESEEGIILAGLWNERSRGSCPKPRDRSSAQDDPAESCGCSQGGYCVL
jgi:hypothetical protein